jgi:SAM-dependent methyltransferase
LPPFDPDRCDLCGGSEVETVLERTGRVLTSDSRVVDGDLLKVRCTACGLVRNGHGFADADLRAHYADYRLAEQAAASEPLFFTPEGPLPRSAVVAEWIRASLEQAHLPPPTSLLEIGCGEGSLLERLSTLWPTARAAGLDMSPDAVALAVARGLEVRVGGYEDAHGSWSLIVSFAVLEHVPSPRHFLQRLGAALSPDGAMVVAQPNQDVGSFDIFFVDHLHHFRSDHVGALAAKAGLAELHRDTAHPLIPDFSLHVLAGAPTAVEASMGPLSDDALRQTIADWRETFGRLETWLRNRAGQNLAVWGLGQTFELLRAYTSLGEQRIALGLDDNAGRFVGAYSFPVAQLEQVGDLPLELDVLLTFIPSEPIIRRLASRDLSFFAPLAAHAIPGGI